MCHEKESTTRKKEYATRRSDVGQTRRSLMHSMKHLVGMEKYQLQT